MNIEHLIILDQCLHEGGKSVADIAQRYREKGLYPSSNNSNPTSSSLERTIQNHIKSVKTLLQKNKFYLPNSDEEVSINHRFDNRTRRYSYSDARFSLFKTPINEKQRDMLQLLIENFAHIQSAVGKEWIDIITENWVQIGDFKAVDNSAIISYEKRYNIKSQVPRYLIDIYEYIKKKVVIKISYIDKKANIPDTIHPHDYILSPAYLKQFNGRWYLYATINDTKEFDDFALDRITDITTLNDMRYIKPKIKLAEIENNVVGINYDPQKPIETIILAVNNERYYAMQETPIHPSQKRIIDNHSLLKKYADIGFDIPEYTLVQLRIQINRELVNTILRYGKDVVVLEPIELREKVQDIIERQQANYQKLIQSTEKSPVK